MTRPWEDEQFPVNRPPAQPDQPRRPDEGRWSPAQQPTEQSPVQQAPTWQPTGGGWAVPNAPSGATGGQPTAPPSDGYPARHSGAPTRPIGSGLPLGGAVFPDPTSRPPTAVPNLEEPYRPQTPPRSNRGGRALVAVLAATSLLGAGWIARDLTVDDGGSGVDSSQAVNTAGRMPSGGVTNPAEDDDEPIAAVAAALAPAVVQIGVGNGVGSGIVYDPSGLVLTNAHVVGSDRTVRVTFSDGSAVDGTVLGSDDLTDVAVVSVEPTPDLVVASIAPESPDVGDLAVAMGSPFGLEQSVTSGVVSAVGRVVSNPQGATVEMLQTDAPINPGNSGGALANRSGEVIGMNTLIYSESGENNGIGFAIPIQTALEVAGRIVGGESLERGFLGVQSQQRNDGGTGALVAGVQPGSPAATAGLRVGDVITEVDGEPVSGSPELAAAVQSYAPGERIELTVERGGEELTVVAELAALDPN